MSRVVCEMWDVDSCYNPIEPPNHWAIKKAFILAHMGKYPKDRLLALANTFYNMEFMGSRYPIEVECLVDSLAKEVPKVVEHRDRKKNGLKRTFVSAQDASRAKCQRTNLDIPKTESQQNYQNNDGRNKNGVSQSDMELVCRVRRQQGVRGNLVLFKNEKTQPYQTVVDSARKMKMEVSLARTGLQKNSELFEFTVKIGSEPIFSDFAETEKKAREVIGPKMLELLQEACFTVLVKTQLDGQSIKKQDTQQSESSGGGEDLLPGDNKGARIMRLMGWTGQGLGKKEDGIQKPIEVTKNVSRMGLCVEGKGIRVLQQKVQQQLEEYLRETAIYNLVFSNEFSNAERKIIHGLAQKLGLKSKSYGANESRQLVVSKKLEPWEIVEQLLANGDETLNHRLIRPTNIT